MSGKPIARIGDRTDHGGTVITGADSIFVENSPVARIGDMVACPKCGGNYPIISGVEHFLGQGKLVAVIGSKTACGATITTGAAHCPANGPLVTTGLMANDAGMMAAQSFGANTATPTTDEAWCALAKEIGENEAISQAREDARIKSHKSKKENGGWIVRDKDGNLKTVPVPEGTEYGLRVGDAPKGTVAWYHTHPNSTHPDEDRASEDDMAINQKHNILGIVEGKDKVTNSTPTTDWLLCP